ncbi:MAG: hypothetical protein IPQ13_09215 [Holophagaceae bacterium]|nr:hypothetical protein [Holophagaceae bacterium]
MRMGRAAGGALKTWIGLTVAAMVLVVVPGCRAKGSKAPSWLQSAPVGCSMAISGQVGWLLENPDFQSAITRIPVAEQTLDLFLKKAKIHPEGETGRITLFLFDIPKGKTNPEDMAADFLLQFDGFKDPRALQMALAESFPPEGSLILDKKDCPLFVMMDINKVKIRALVDPQERIVVGDLRALGRRAAQGTLSQGPKAAHALGAGEWIDATAPIAGYVNPDALMAGVGGKLPGELTKEFPKGLESLVWSVTPAKNAEDPKGIHRLELAIGGSPEGINQASHWVQRLVAAASQLGAQQQLAPVLMQEKTRVGVRYSASNEQIKAILGSFGQSWVSMDSKRKPPKA